MRRDSWVRRSAASGGSKQRPRIGDPIPGRVTREAAASRRRRARRQRGEQRRALPRRPHPRRLVSPRPSPRARSRPSRRARSRRTAWPSWSVADRDLCTANCRWVARGTRTRLGRCCWRRQSERGPRRRTRDGVRFLAVVATYARRTTLSRPDSSRRVGRCHM